MEQNIYNYGSISQQIKSDGLEQTIEALTQSERTTVGT